MQLQQSRARSSRSCRCSRAARLRLLTLIPRCVARVQVLQVKQLLHLSHGFAPPPHQQLWLGGYELQPEAVLGSTGVADQSMLELVVEYSQSLLLSAVFFTLAASIAAGIVSWNAWQRSFECQWVGRDSPAYLGRGLSADSCVALNTQCFGWLPPSQQSCPSFSGDVCVAIVSETRPLRSGPRLLGLSSWCRVEVATLSSAVDFTRPLQLSWAQNQMWPLLSLACFALALLAASWLLWRLWCAVDQRVLSPEIKMRLLPHGREIDPETA